MVAVAEHGAERIANGSVAECRRAVDAALPDEEQDREGDDDRRDAEEHDDPAPPEQLDQPGSEDGNDDRSDVPAADVGADRKAASRLRKLFREQSVPDWMLRRPAHPRQDVDGRE